LGIAVSDPTGTISTPLAVIRHLSREVDAAAIAQIANEQEAGQIIIGQSLDEEGNPTYQGRRAARLAEAIRRQTTIPVALWDEWNTTRSAREIRVRMGSSRNKRQGHLDDLAAAILLQSYLDAQGSESEKPGSFFDRLQSNDI
jgi:putative Holliday junction resolvase